MATEAVVSGSPDSVAGGGAGTTPDTSRPQPELGRRLKTLRVSRGLSLKDVAGRTGVSASFLSMVETGRNEMSVGRLMTMADFYEVGLSDLVPDRAAKRPVVLRRDERLTFDSADHRVKTQMLASWSHVEMSSGMLRFDSGGELEEVASQAGPQFVLVLSGELGIEFSDDTSVVLAEGDSVCFEASRPHRHVNLGEGETHAISFRSGTSSDRL